MWHDFTGPRLDVRHVSRHFDCQNLLPSMARGFRVKFGDHLKGSRIDHDSFPNEREGHIILPSSLRCGKLLDLGLSRTCFRDGQI